jgi:hypothetical protein
MHEIVVFLGPSCDQWEARSILEARYCPPAKRGDILRAVEAGARIIGLIDGVFLQDVAVAHREILHALRTGVRVVGASSMGALRAAELDVLGMEGVGKIYRAYRDGDLVADDEVALIIDPATQTPLSEPLVNIRYTVLDAVEAGILSEASGDAFIRRARSIYFPDRTYAIIAAAARSDLDPIELDRFMVWVRDHARDVKHEDAISALRYIRELAEELGIPQKMLFKSNE